VLIGGEVGVGGGGGGGGGGEGGVGGGGGGGGEVKNTMFSSAFHSGVCVCVYVCLYVSEQSQCARRTYMQKRPAYILQRYLHIYIYTKKT